MAASNGAEDLVIKKSAKNLIQTRFDDDADLSVMTDKDTVKAAKRAERDERKAKAAAEAASQRVQGALHGDAPVIERNTCAAASGLQRCWQLPDAFTV